MKYFLSQEKSVSLLRKNLEPQGSKTMRFRHHLFTCTNTATCAQHHSEEIQQYLKARLRELKLHREIRANKSGCLDACSFSPVTVIYPEGIWYRISSIEEAEEILQQHILGGKPVTRLMIRELNPHYDFAKESASSV